MAALSFLLGPEYLSHLYVFVSYPISKPIRDTAGAAFRIDLESDKDLFWGA